MSLRRTARLLRWLGPWTPTERVPPAVARSEVEVRGGARPLRAWVWRPIDEPPSGSLLLVPGLHFLGPADPRMERFARVLARSGLLVLAPFLPDFQSLVVGRALVPDTEAAFDALLAQPDRPPVRPGVFSISFGSMPALRLAAARAGEIASLVVFGGFADFRATLRFALGGDGARANDPLNAPVVFINLVDCLEVDPADREALCAAWRWQCERTWGKEESKAPEVYVPIARALAGELPERLRELFLVGCRAAPGTVERALRALERAGDAFDWIDPRPHLGALQCDVHLVHGLDDDVIPFEQSEALLRAMPSYVRARLHLTGLYGHSRGASLRALLREAGAAAREVGTLVRIVHAIATSSRP